jgi:hypothetical protein
MKYLNTSTIIRKILVPKKLLSSVRKYVKQKPIFRQNQKLTQQHNWKKSSSSPREASVSKWNGLFCGGGKFFYLLIFSHQISVDLRREVVWRSPSRPVIINKKKKNVGPGDSEQNNLRN